MRLDGAKAAPANVCRRLSVTYRESVSTKSDGLAANARRNVNNARSLKARPATASISERHRNVTTASVTDDRLRLAANSTSTAIINALSVPRVGNLPVAPAPAHRAVTPGAGAPRRWLRGGRPGPATSPGSAAGNESRQKTPAATRQAQPAG